MPFGGYFDRYYSEVIKPTLERLELIARRADEIYGTNAIITDIYTAIADANICIADVTGRNPNVSYELGMAHSLAKPVVIITQDIKDVPFDYRHWRIIEYDPRAVGWERKLAVALENTTKEVLTRPGDYVPFKILGTQESKMRTHLLNIFSTVDCLLDKYDVITMDESGSVRARTTWTFAAQVDVFHICENRAIDKPGRIDILRAYDRLNGRNMEIIEIERTPTHLSYLMLMSSFKKPGQRFVLETEMYLENYMGMLPSTGSESMAHQAAAKSQIKYKRLREEFRLPKLAGTSMLTQST
jgi:hypothetical protein